MSYNMSWRSTNTHFGTHICIRLIHLVKQHPIIYSTCKESTPYPKKKRHEVNEIWRNISREIELSVEDCKRRWKGLKDVYAKIRKRRLQDGVLGITVKKKWVYEDLMSFIKFPFEKLYQKALENFEEVNCNDWKIEETESNDTAEDVFNDCDDPSENKEEERKEEIEDGTVEYLDLDLEVESVPDSEAYEEIQTSERDESSENRTEIQTPILEEESGPSEETKTNTRSRYRIISSKPYQQSYLSRNRIVSDENGTTKVSKVSNLNSLNKMIASNPLLKQGRNSDGIISASSNTRVQNYGREASDGVSSTSQVMVKLDSCKNLGINSPLISSYNQNNVSSVELFFQSMAQSVMNLPMQVQAEIKMEVCKVVTKAEIQYSSSQSLAILESDKSRSEEG